MLLVIDHGFKFGLGLANDIGTTRTAWKSRTRRCAPVFSSQNSSGVNYLLKFRTEDFPFFLGGAYLLFGILHATRSSISKSWEAARWAETTRRAKAARGPKTTRRAESTARTHLLKRLVLVG